MLADVREYIVEPALSFVGLAGLNREQQVLGTGLVESGYKYLDQTTPGVGPAYGFWQMEKATHDDLWMNFINGRPMLRDSMRSLVSPVANFRSIVPPVSTLHHNLLYAAAMCAVHYLRAPGVHPAAGDYGAQAAYWKRVYNTMLGAGKVEHAIPLFKKACNL